MALSHPVPPSDAPVTEFAQCHRGILAGLEQMAQLPQLVAAAVRLREVARGVAALFDGSVLEHHADEEKELFPAVLRSAAPGDERELVATLVARLEYEHRAVEGLWRQLRTAVRSAAAGKPVAIDEALLNELVARYTEHAQFEETAFLPLAKEILGRDGNHMAALGVSLHLRHSQLIVPAYI